MSPEAGLRQTPLLPGAWIRLDAPAAAALRGPVPVSPRHGGCSVPACAGTATVAVLRSNGRGWVKHWQAYCTGHAEDRGVRLAGEGLEWTPAYLRNPPPGLAATPGG